MWGVKLQPFPLCNHELIGILVGNHANAKRTSQKHQICRHMASRRRLLLSVVIVEGFFSMALDWCRKSRPQLSDKDNHEDCLDFVFWFNWTSGDRFDY
jgi:hypothetical protein